MTRIFYAITYILLFTTAGFTARAQYDSLYLLNDFCPGPCDGMPAVMGTINGNLIINGGGYDNHNAIYTYNKQGLLSVDSIDMDAQPLYYLPITSPHSWQVASIMMNNEIYYCGTNMRTDSLRLYKWSGSGYPEKVRNNTGFEYALMSPLAYDNKIYLSGYAVTTFDPATFVYDPKTNELAKIADKQLTNGIVYKDKFYVTHSDSLAGIELHEFNPKTGELRMLKDYNPGIQTGNPNSMLVVNDKLYFLADDTVYNTVLYEYTGTGDPKPVLRFEKKPGEPFNSSKIFTPFYHDGKLYMQCNIGYPQPRVYHYTYDIYTGKIGQDTMMDRLGANMPYVTYNGKMAFWSYTGGAAGIFPRIFLYDAAKGTAKELPFQDTTLRPTTATRFDVYGGSLYVSLATAETGYEMFKYTELPPPDVNTVLYPNPTKDVAYLRTGLDTNNVLTLIIHDAQGRLVTQQRLGIFMKGNQTIPIQVGHLAAGVYICTLRGSKHILFRGKLVKL